MLDIIGIATGSVLDDPPLVVRVDNADFGWLTGLDLQFDLLLILHGATRPITIGCLILAFVGVMAILETLLASHNA